MSSRREPRRPGRPGCAFAPCPASCSKVAEVLRRLPGIVECDRITGEDCYITRAYVESIAELERLIDRIARYVMTNTSNDQSSPVPRRLPPLAPGENDG